MPRPPRQRDPNERYPVMLCAHCKHPGGQHVLDGDCRLCADCPGWGDRPGVRGWWSDRMTDDLLAAMEAEEGDG